MEMKIPLVAISAFVVVVVLAAVLMPVLGDATDTEDTYTNEGYYKMDLVDSSTTKTIRWNIADPSILVVDGTDFDMEDFTTINRSYTFIGSDTFVCRYYPQNTRTLVQIYTSGNEYYSYSDQDTMTYVEFSIANGLLTITSDKSGAESGSVSIGTECYVISPTGEYAAVMKKADTSVYVLGDSPIRFIGVTGSSSANTFGTYGVGTIDDGMTLSTLYMGSNYTTITFGEATPTMVKDNNHVSLYSLDSYTFTANIDGTDQDVTYSYFIVPAEVTAEKSVHLTGNEIALLATIPALVIIALLIGVLALFVRSKMD